MKFNNITPNLIVRDVSMSVLFYKNILDFTLELAVPIEESSIEKELRNDKDYSYAMIRKDEVCLMFIEEHTFHKEAFEMQVSKGAALFYIDVQNIEELYEKIKDKVEIEKSLNTTWYGMKEFYIKDLDGYLIGFGERENLEGV